MQKYDVIVIGAGPAGSVAGSMIAGAGRKVCVLEKEFFPRDKVCGDLVTNRAIGSFLGIRNVAERIVNKGYHKIHGSRVIFPNGRSVHHIARDEKGEADYHLLIPRVELDQILANNVRQSGGDLIEGFHVRRIVETNGTVTGVEGIKDGSPVALQADIVIAADGESTVSRYFLKKKRNRPQHVAVATRAYFDDVQMDEDTAEHYFDPEIPFGYGWIFPLGKGRANAGVILRCDAYKNHGKKLSNIFADFIERNPVAKGRMANAKIRGKAGSWPLSLGTQAMKNHAAGLLVAGDAGSFIDPFSGEGIYYACLTGKLAAETAMEALSRGDVSASSLENYEKRWKQHLGPIYRRKFLAAEVVYRTTNLRFYRFKPWLIFLGLVWRSHAQTMSVKAVGVSPSDFV